MIITQRLGRHVDRLTLMAMINSQKLKKLQSSRKEEKYIQPGQQQTRKKWTMCQQEVFKTSEQSQVKMKFFCVMILMIIILETGKLHI